MKNLHPAAFCLFVGFASSLAILARSSATARGVHRGGFLLAIVACAAAVIALGLRPAETEISAAITLAGALAMFVLGLIEEKRPLRLRWKLLAQCAIASGIYLAGLKVLHFKNPFTGAQYDLEGLSYMATIIWLVGTLNVIHLIAAVESVSQIVILLMMGLLAFLSFGQHYFSFCLSCGLGGALLAMTIANAPARGFGLGKAGSYLVGALTGMMALANSQKGTVIVALLAPLFIICLPLLEATAALRRTTRLAAQPLTGKMHAELIQIGFSKVKTAMLIHDLSIVGLALAFALSWSQGRSMALFFGLCFLLVLLSAFIFKRESSAMAGLFRGALALRKQTDYALGVSRLLEAEAERCASLEELWRDYQFMVRRLGFIEARRGTGEPAGSDSGADGKRDKRWFRQKLPGGSTLDLAAMGAESDPKMESLMVELAAEIWLNAQSKWRALHPSERESG